MPWSMIPLPMVVATLKWKMNRAAKLKKAAITTACCGFSTPVETTVAIELAASWKPFMKSKATARATRRAMTQNEIWTRLIRRLRHPSRQRPSRILEDDALDQVGDVLAAVGDRLEPLVHGA